MPTDREETSVLSVLWWFVRILPEGNAKVNKWGFWPQASVLWAKARCKPSVSYGFAGSISRDETSTLFWGTLSCRLCSDSLPVASVSESLFGVLFFFRPRPGLDFALLGGGL